MSPCDFASMTGFQARYYMGKFVMEFIRVAYKINEQ